MARSHVYVALGFGAVGLIAGYLLIQFSQHERLIDSDDSPVVVRGGSVVGLSKDKWTPVPNVKGVWTISGAGTTAVSMSGVEVNGGAAQSVSAPSLTTNWYMTLDFRDKNDADDPTYQLQLCTSYPCSSSGSLTGALYLVDLHNNGKLDLSKETNDGFYGLRYDVQSCNDASPDVSRSRCNHIDQITVTGITFSGGVQGPFTCRAGACDIGIGQ
jgi:hypothetical protein